MEKARLIVLTDIGPWTNEPDDALVFEPIYRVVFHVDPTSLLSELRAYLASLKGSAARQTLTAVGKGFTETFVAETPVAALTVGTLQDFLDGYAKVTPRQRSIISTARTR